MLPGFRFLFAAIVLSTSILVFGVGAAALLRATHEQAVAIPSWRTGPQDQAFAQAPTPVLAVLRAEPMPAAAAPSLRDEVPTVGLPDSGPEQQAGPASRTSLPAEPQVADAANAPGAAVTADAPKAELVTSGPPETPPAPAPISTPEATLSVAEDLPAPAASTASEPPPVETTAPVAQASAAEPAPTANTPQPTASAAATDSTPAKTAALSKPAAPGVRDAPRKAKADNASDSKATKRRAKAKKRHRVVRRPPPQPAQQSFDPFAQQQPAFAATTTRTRR